jgi:Ca2+-transporting ATPase
MAEIFWHNLSKEEVVKTLRSDIEKGLTEKEVEIRQREFGKNKLPEEKPPPKLSLFLAQFKSILIFILIVAGFFTLIYQKYTDTVAIFLIVLINAIIGFYQEYRASKILEELKKIIKIEARITREGNQKILDSEEIVPGDIVILTAGDKVPADGRVIESQNLKLNEMVLTGEFFSSLKHSEILPEETILADRENMVYMGTVVEEGQGKAIVTETGVNTEIGKIAGMIKVKEKRTPLQRKIRKLGFEIALIVGILVAFIFFVGLNVEKDIFLLFETAVAVAVGAVPEGLPVAITVILALGAQRILRKKGLVRKLASVETLGSTTIICADKTLTLTEGRMEVDEVIPAFAASFAEVASATKAEKATAGKGDKFLALKAAALTSEAFVENPQDPKEKWILRGRPTEKALLKAAIEIGINQKKEYEKKQIKKLPFSPKNKFAAALYQDYNPPATLPAKGRAPDGEMVLYVCGAPEKILELSNLTDGEKRDLEKRLNELTQKGLRVVASAYKKIENQKSKIKNLEDEINNLTFTGFITLKDPIRPEVKEAMEVCRQAGIRPIIVTGDHKLTAKTVAEELGFKIKEENILEGRELDKLSDEEFEKILDKIQIYARVEPRHKMRIVEAWQDRGEVVAMTGDGVNDAPALKKADIGVALGSGTEVAKEASDLVLLNDSFSVIEEAIREGRRVMDNARKAILFMCAECFSEIILVFGAFLFGLPLPILPVQILWENLIEGSPQGMALAFEPEEKGIMKRKPEDPKLPLISREIKYLILFGGILTDILLLLIFFLLYKFSNYDISHLRTISFAGLMLGSFFYAFSCKNLRKNIWEYNAFSNKVLNFTIFLAVLLLITVIYLPVFQVLLSTFPLNLFDWSILMIFGFINLALFELVKYFLKKPND